MASTKAGLINLSSLEEERRKKVGGSGCVIFCVGALKIRASEMGEAVPGEVFVTMGKRVIQSRDPVIKLVNGAEVKI